MIIGSIAGLNQSRIKRLMAYSSIAHVGFILMAISTNTIIGIQTAIIYTIIYIITSICIFTSIIIIYDKTDYITELAGYGRRNGVVAMGLSLGLYSAAGIPPLAGFFAK
jgi:NADH:ubiquinone oxidoreductase subunit 2 (subunit N)